MRKFYSWQWEEALQLYTVRDNYGRGPVLRMYKRMDNAVRYAFKLNGLWYEKVEVTWEDLCG